jgi:hypothetical protein
MYLIIITLLYFLGIISISTISVIYISNKLSVIIYEKIENFLNLVKFFKIF